MSMKLKLSTLETAINEVYGDISDEDVIDYRPDYRGRGMYGKEGCLAFVVDEPNEAYLLMLEIAIQIEKEDEVGAVSIVDEYDIRENLSSLLEGSVCIDSMGKQMIIYWPNIIVDKEK